MATIMSLIFSKHKWVFPVTFFWAATVSIAQVYVGVHYPLDITGGALLGMAISYGVWTGYKRIPYKIT
jgi:undecaprenyl-diphosphatase